MVRVQHFLGLFFTEFGVVFLGILFSRRFRAFRYKFLLSDEKLGLLLKRMGLRRGILQSLGNNARPEYLKKIPALKKKNTYKIGHMVLAQIKTSRTVNVGCILGQHKMKLQTQFFMYFTFEDSCKSRFINFSFDFYKTAHRVNFQGWYLLRAWNHLFWIILIVHPLLPCLKMVAAVHMNKFAPSIYAVSAESVRSVTLLRGSYSI